MPAMGHPHASGEDGEMKRPMSPSRVAIIAAIIGAMGAIVAAVISTSGGGGDPGPTAVTPPPAAATRPPPAAPGRLGASPQRFVEATVINTGGIGVWKWDEPTNTSGKRYGPAEGEVVRVVCQRRDGQLITETDPAPGQPAQWPVWDRLEEGKWIPDLYTNLPKVPGPVPPEGLPNC